METNKTIGEGERPLRVRLSAEANNLLKALAALSDLSKEVYLEELIRREAKTIGLRRTRPWSA